MTVKLSLLSLLCVLVSCQRYGKNDTSSSNEVLYSTSWDRGIDRRIQREIINDDAIKIVSLNDEWMPRALEVTIRRSDNYAKLDSGTPRAELSFSGIVRFVRGENYTINWQTYIPAKYVFDKKQPEVISQIHQGGKSGYPTFALFISESGKYGVRVRAGEGRESEGKQFDDVEQDKGRVVNWCMHYIPDDTGKSAVLNLRKDGKEVFSISGIPNAYKSDDNSYFKIGLYKSGWQKKPTDVEFRRLYYGKISISRVK